MRSPFKPRPVESGINPGEGFKETATNVDIYRQDPEGITPNAERNTQIEIKAGAGEDKGYETFSIKGFLDGLRVTGKDFGIYSKEMEQVEEALQKECGVEIIKNVVENPYGRGEAIKGGCKMPWVSDLHMSTKPLESNRTYTISQKEKDAKWHEFKHVGYMIIRWVEKGLYKLSEGNNGGGLRDAGIQRFMNILPEVLECDSDNLTDLGEKLMNEHNEDPIIKYAWNRAIIFREKWKNEEKRIDLIKELTDEEEKVAKKRTSATEFREQKIWEIRNKLIEVLIPELLTENLGDTERSTIIAFDGGDAAHDGGVLADHMNIRKLLINTFRQIPAVKKFLASTGGNHEQDAREPKALQEIFNYYGERIFYQHVESTEKDGKKNLIVGLNTFIMADQWSEVLDAYLKENEEKLTQEQIEGLKMKRNSMIRNQEKVFEEMSNFNGNCIVIHAHNSRRLLEYLEKNGKSFKNGVQVKIISGHTHEDDNYRALVAKPVTISTYIKEFIEIYKSSGFIIIDGKKIRLPKGLMTVIDAKGNVTVKSLEFSHERKDIISKELGMTVY